MTFTANGRLTRQRENRTTAGRAFSPRRLQSAWAEGDVVTAEKVFARVELALMPMRSVPGIVLGLRRGAE